MESKIAVVGLGALFPGSLNVTEFWQNILAKKSFIQPLPEETFESQVFFRPELLTAFNKEDKSVTRMAGWIENLAFDSVKKYKIPPSVAEHMDANQHAALYTTDQALALNPLGGVANDRVAVIFGNGMVGTRYGDAILRVQFQLMEHYLRQHPAFLALNTAEQDDLVEHIRRNLLKDTIPITEDTAPGVLPNLIAGRIANVYDFHGPSFTVDAACASVLAAVIMGIQGLQLNHYDAVICGGADMPLKSLGLVLFSALNALSPDGSYPFDQRANGFVMGQGAGTVLLKRLPDAIRDQDTIYALITGHGEASDGKGKYIAAPNAEWQARAIEKACRMAGYAVDSIEMIEAHGTATKVGDVVEVEGLKQAFKRLGAQRTHYCGLTSVKSNIGHLKSAAGIAGLIKAVLAIHHQTLAPTANFETINPKLELEGSPFYILDEVHQWEPNPAYPRRANVSSFGFGGADYHLALEEYRPQDYPPGLFSAVEVPGRAQGSSSAGQPASQAAPADALASPRLEAVQRPSADVLELPQVVFFAAPTPPGLRQQVQEFLTRCQAYPDLSFSEHCQMQNYTVRPGDGTRLAILAASALELAEKTGYLAQNQAQLDGELLKTKGIYLKHGPSITPAQTAILFPGQASQYLHMFRGAYQSFDLLRTWFRKADAYWFARYGTTVTALIYPLEQSEEEALEQLRQTHNAHPGIFIASFGLHDLLRQTGLQANYMIGHSLGEITALAASGMLTFEDALKLVEQRGMAFFHENLPDPGGMLSLALERAQAEALILESGFEVSVANLNSPRQTIVAGRSDQIQAFKRFLDEKKFTNKVLFVSHAFHTALLQPVAARFLKQIKDIPFQASPVRVMMNHTSDFYPHDPQSLLAIPQLLSEQILQPVNFMAGIQRLYQEGVRLFVELGPGSILSSLVKEILDGQPVSVLTANYKNSSDLVSLQKLYAALFAEGVPVQPLAIQPAPSHGLSAALQPVQAPPAPQPVASSVPPLPGASAKIHVVYSGAAIGLPGSYKDAFRDDNFDQLFAGHNLIERLTDAERQALVDLQISKLIKKDDSSPTFKLLASLEEAIQLAGKVGRIDLIRDYHLDEKLIQNMSSCIALGVAAGYEALRDAHIPLVREYSQATTGKWLPQKLALPPDLQDETGVIFANGFPLIDPVIQEVSRFISYTYGSKTRKELMTFYESLISRVKDDNARKLLSDWYTLYYSRLSDQPGQEEVYRFNHHFMTQISAQANNLLAYLINARGPNFQLNAACSSTSNAITIAEDFIRTGRARRMIVVGADDPTSRTNLPLLGAGFLCTGAATNEGDLYQAAIPFDRRRNGMIVGSGAVGLILESQSAAEQRGIRPICELLGTFSFNTAKSIAQIDAESFARQMDCFIQRMEQEYGLKRADLARQTVYISHETYTPPRGGCSQTEAVALRRVFGEDFRHIIVGNTKGMTGHLMGASLEDAVAAKSLQYGKCPPVVNFSQPDPQLEGLQLWSGGPHERSFALKMSAGFGAQGHFALLRKTCTGDARIADPARYQAWLQQASGDPAAKTELSGRILTITDSRAVSGSPQTAPGRATQAAPVQAGLASPPSTPGLQAQPAIQQGLQDIAEARPIHKPDRRQFEELAIEQIAQVTGYPPEMLEMDMEFSADLGIEGARLEAVQVHLSQSFDLTPGGVQLGKEQTVGQALDQLYQAFLKKQSTTSTPPAPIPTIEPPPEPGQVSQDKQALIEDTLALFAQVTKYPQEILELDMEMEADLGIDTVKQATILAMLAEKYQLERDETIQLSNYPTIRALIELVYQRSLAAATTAPEKPLPSALATPASQPAAVPPVQHCNLSRMLPYLAAEPLGPPSFELPGKHLWVIGDESPVVEQMAGIAAQKGARVKTLVFPPREQLERTITEFFSATSSDGMIDAIIDCSHLGRSLDFTRLEPASAEDLLFCSSTARFAFYKHISETKKIPQQVLCLTASDGAFGLAESGPAIQDPTFGALAGFYKGLRKEWADCVVRILELPIQEMAGIPEAALELALLELEHTSRGVEIAYLAGKRHIVKVRDQALPAGEPFSYSAQDTFLLTGGGSGITAQVVLALAQALPVNLVILDLVPLPENIAELATLDESGLEQLRQQLHKRLQQEHTRVTPAMLNREFEQITRAVEIYRNLQTLEQLQRKVVYIACDVRDRQALQSELQRARQKVGPVTAILHAAGVDHSHLLDQKSVAEFEQVFSVKALGALNLMHLCQDDPLRMVAAFSSIAGRFGNPAQLDYCAANHFLSDWVKMMKHARPGLHAISLAWSGWKDLGIAWRNEFVRQRAEEIGLNLIPVEQGTAAFLGEIQQASAASEVIYHKGLDGFIEPGLADIYLPDFPLIDRLTLQDEGLTRAYRQFSVRRDSLIDQHRLGKVPILPAVAYTELAVEYFALQNGFQDHYLLRQISFSNAFKLFHEEPRELYVEGQVDPASGAWKVEIKSSFKPARATTTQTILHSQALVSAGPLDLSQMNPRAWTYHQDQPVSLPAEKSLRLIDSEGPEQRIILGPLFDDVVRETRNKIPVLIYPRGVEYPAYFPMEQLTNPKYPLERLLVNPCFLDSLYQTCAAYLLVNRERVYLPWEVGEIGILNVPRQPGEYTCHAQVVAEDQETVSFDVVMLDQAGQVCYYVRQARFRLINL